MRLLGTVRFVDDYKSERRLIEVPQSPPTGYKHWSGATRRVESDAPYPHVLWIDADDGGAIIGHPYLPRVGEPGPSGWQWYEMGWVRRPARPSWARAVFDWRHGRMMGYPRLSVLAWVWRHSIRREHKVSATR